MDFTLWLGTKWHFSLTNLERMIIRSDSRLMVSKLPLVLLFQICESGPPNSRTTTLDDAAFGFGSVSSRL